MSSAILFFTITNLMNFITAMQMTISTSKHEIHSENSQREALATCAEEGYNRLASFQFCLGQGN
jgi:hypothetical protein